MSAPTSAAPTGLTPQAVADLLVEQFGGDVRGVVVEHGDATVTLDPGTWQRAARFCKSDPRLRMTFFDWMSGVDEREEGFGVVVSLYSVEHRHRVLLRMIAPGGREAPVAPSLTSIYGGANWHERELYDMYGVDFEGHPGVLPRILTVENFEGFPLRKEFLLATREAKPWPGAKEPGESGDAGGPQAVASIATPTPVSAEEKVAAAKAKAESVKTDAAAARARTAVAPAEEGVALDQETYDRLIAEGKSDRIARAKAKAVAMRRAKSGEPAPAAPPTVAPPTPPTADPGTEAVVPAVDDAVTSVEHGPPAGATAAAPPPADAGRTVADVGTESLAEPVRSTPEGVVPDPAPAEPAPQIPIADAPAQGAGLQGPSEAGDLPADLDPGAHDLDTYRSQIAEGKSDRQARAKAKAAKLRAARSGGDVDGAAAAAVAVNAGDVDPSTPEGAAEVAAEDLADPSVAMDAAAGAVGGDLREGAPGDRVGAETPVSDPYLEARVGTGAPPVPGGSPGPESEGRRTGAVEQSGLRPAATTPGMTGEADTVPERGQSRGRLNEPPVPGPESDHPGGALAPADQPEVRPAPGSAEAPLADEAGPGGPGGAEATTTQDTGQPASAPGTDAADRGGPTYEGSATEPDAEPRHDGADDQRGNP